MSYDTDLAAESLGFIPAEIICAPLHLYPVAQRTRKELTERPPLDLIHQDPRSPEGSEGPLTSSVKLRCSGVIESTTLSASSLWPLLSLPVSGPMTKKEDASTPRSGTYGSRPPGQV